MSPKLLPAAPKRLAALGRRAARLMAWSGYRRIVWHAASRSVLGLGPEPDVARVGPDGHILGFGGQLATVAHNVVEEDIIHAVRLARTLDDHRAGPAGSPVRMMFLKTISLIEPGFFTLIYWFTVGRSVMKSCCPAPSIRKFSNRALRIGMSSPGSSKKGVIT